MTGKDILIGLGNIDEQFIHEAEHKLSNKMRNPMNYVLPIAASFIIVMLVLGVYGSGGIEFLNFHTDGLPPIASDPSDNSAAGYQLQFNEVSMTSADSKVSIKGHFWKELEVEQAKKILPNISKKYEIDGTVHYSSADGEAALYEVSNFIRIDEAIYGTITIAPNEIVKDCIIVGEPIFSEIEGVKIEAGLFVTDKNSRGEQNYIYYADFKMDDSFYYLEFVSEGGEAEAIFTSIVADVILGGKADFSVFDHPSIPEIID